MKKIIAWILVLTLCFSLVACGGSGTDVEGTQTEATVEATEVPAEQEETTEAVEATEAAEPQGPGPIYIYGESHGVKEYIEKELALWQEHYANGARHLFLEDSYFTAYQLNLWMKEQDDAMFDVYFDSNAGTFAGSPFIREFFMRLKETCPETVFHGFDVGHSYESLGSAVLTYLEINGMKDSEAYSLVGESIEQGKKYYGTEEVPDEAYRENQMVENFLRELATVNGDVMVITGAAHSDVDGNRDNPEMVPSMASQLVNDHGVDIVSQNVYDLVLPKSDTLTIGGKEYAATYYNEEYIGLWLPDHVSRAYWHVEDAYEDFKDKPLTGNGLPDNNYPMEIQQGEVYAIRYTLSDGSIRMEYLRTDGNVWDGMMLSEEFIP